MANKDYGGFGAEAAKEMLKELLDVASQLRDAGYDAGAAVGEGFEDGMEDSVETIQKSEKELLRELDKFKKAFSRYLDKLPGAIQKAFKELRFKDLDNISRNIRNCFMDIDVTRRHLYELGVEVDISDWLGSMKEKADQLAESFADLPQAAHRATDSVEEHSSALEGQARATEHAAAAQAKLNRTMREQSKRDGATAQTDAVSALTKKTNIKKMLDELRVPEDDAKLITQTFEHWAQLISNQVRNSAKGFEDIELSDEINSVMKELVDMIMASGSIKRENIKYLSEFYDDISSRKIGYSEEDIAEFGDEWASIVKRFGRGKYRVLDKSARGIDTIWEELVEKFPELFPNPDEQTTQGQLRQVLDLLQRARDERNGRQTVDEKTPDSMFDDILVELGQCHAQIVENVTGIITQEAKKAASNAAKNPNGAVSVEDIVEKDINEALEQLRSANNNKTTLINLKGVFSTDDLVEQFTSMVENIAEHANLSIEKITVRDSVAQVRLYNEELKVTVDQTYQLVRASKDAEASLELVSQSFSQNVKALNANTFDVDGVRERALASIEKVRSSLHGLEYDLTGLENAARNISSQDDFTRFNNQLKATQDNIQAIKNSTVSKNSMNPLANMQRDMQNANIEIETMRLKLEKFGDIQGVAEAKRMLEEMTAAAEQYNSATDAQGQQEAYNRYSNIRSTFKAQTEYINAAKSSHGGDIANQYKTILDLINKINAANERMIKLQKIDGGTGILGQQIEEEQQKRLMATESLNAALSEINVGGVLGSDKYTLPDDIKSIGTDYSKIASFINDAGVQAALTTAEIDKLVNALVKAEDIDLSMISGIFGNESVIALAKQTAYENKYFSDKTSVSIDEYGNTNLGVENIQKLGAAGDATKEKLEGLAQAIASNSDNAVALTKSFSQGADGIARLDFSILDTNTGSIKDFTIALGTATGQVAVFETTVDKSVKNIQNAKKQMSSAQDLIGRLGFGDVSAEGGDAPRQVTKMLETIELLRSELASGDSADQNKILEYTADLKVFQRELESSEKQIRNMEAAFANGTAHEENNIDPRGDIYAQLVQRANEYAETQGRVTLEVGKFDSTTNTLNASLIGANGTVENLKFTMYGFNGEVARQETGINKLATSWDRFQSGIRQVGKQLMTALVGYNVFYKAISEVRKGINYVKEIDLALTELKKVTDETEESYRQFLNTSASSAGEIGSTLSDFTEASAAFARLGYTMEESADMAKTAIVYKNVAEGLDTVEESTESIISTMKAFGIESDDTMGIIDRFNEVGNNFAITSAGIGEALQRSASALYAAGNTIDESIALVTAANSVIQNPEQVGTALKTLALRLRGAKVDLEEAGLETENMAESTSTLQAKLKALTHGKVDIMLDADTFKNTTQILREMSQAWEDMTDIERASALELMGGKRQANILSSLISNFETVEEVIETSMNSSGSAMEENAKWLDSIEGKSTQLTNAMQTLWNETINSDVIKFFLDVALGATEVVDAIGMLPSALAAALVYFTAFKKQSISGLFHDMYVQLQTYQQSLYKLNTLGKLNLDLGTAGNFNTSAVKAYADAVAGLTAKKQAEALATSGLNKIQIAEVMARNGVEDAVIKETLSKTNLANSTKILHTTTVQEALATQLSTDAMQEKIVADFLAANGSKKLTAELLAQMVQQELLTTEQAANIASSYALAGANNVLGASFKTVGLAIKSAFLSNPVGIILTIITSVTSLVSWLGSLKKTNEELIQQATELKNAYKEESDTIQGNISTIQGLEEEFNKLSRGVDDYGNNISLATDDYARYREIIETIVGISPSLISGYDAEGNALANKNGLLQKSIELMQKEQQLKTKEYLSSDNIKKITNGATAQLNSDIDKIVDNNRAISSFGVQISKNGKEQYMGTQHYIADFIEQTIGVERDIWDESVQDYIINNAEVIDEHMGEILNLFSAGFTTDDGVTWKGIAPEGVEELKLYITSILNAADSASNEVRSMLQMVPQLEDGYYNLESSTQQFLNQYVNSFHITKDTTKSDIDDMINKVSKFTDFIINNSEVEATIQVGFNLNSGKDADGNNLNVSRYKQQVAEFKKQIKNSAYTEDQKSTILSMFGLDDDDVMKNDIEKAIQHVANILKGEADKLSTEAQTYLDNLSITEALHIKANISTDVSGLSVDELKQKVHETYNFNITDYTDAISAHSAVISEYQKALQSLEKGSFTMNDFVELVEKYPELAKGVDVSSNSFLGLSRNLNGAIKTSTKDFIKQLKELKSHLVAAGKSTEYVDQLIEAIENMPEDALDGTIQKYSTLADKIDSARRAQDKLSASMEENPNEGYETRGEAMDYMKEAMKKGEIGSESNLWNVAKQYGFTYDSAATINDNADALAKFIATRERWFKTEDDEDGNSSDKNYVYKGTENFIKDVESAVTSSEELQKYLTWDYDENTGTLKYKYNNKDWDTIVSILSKTKQLAGLTSDEFSDLITQVGQYFETKWGDYDDVLDHLNGIATGASDAKTKVEEYGQSMQNYFGDKSDVDLTSRPMVSGEAMQQAGWTNVDKDSYATVYSSTFSNEDGTKSVVVTPILPDGTVLSPEQLKEYANKLLAGEDLDPGIDIKLSEFDGLDSVDKANKYAEALHNAQAEYDTLRDTLSINTTIDSNGLEGLKEIKEIQSAIEQQSDGTVLIDEDAFRLALTAAQYTEDQIDIIVDKIKRLNDNAFNVDKFNIADTLENGITGLENIGKIRDSITKDSKTGITVFDTDMFTSILNEAGYAEDRINSLIKKIQEYESVISVSGNTDPLGLNSAKVSVDNFRASLSALGVEYGGSNKKVKIDVEDLVTVLKQKGWTDASIKEYITKLSESANLDGFDVKINGIKNIDDIIKAASSVPAEKQTDYEVIGAGATTLDGIEKQWSEVTKDKTTNYTINETTVKKTEEDSGFKLFKPSTWFSGANGTAHASGNAFAGGSWGAPRTEDALVGELGPEILVRNGRWTTVGENGAEFTQVKKGDIIFNHKQSEQLLKNGYVTGRGKAYASGTAYAEANGTFARYEFSGSGGWQQYDVNDKVVESWGDLSGKISDASEGADKFEDTLDWVEIRLEEINEQLDLMGAQLENAGDAASKNNIIDKIVGVNTNKMDNIIAGIKKYSEYASRLLSDVPSQYRDAAQDGAIAITEFAGEADEKTVKAIEKYREWAQKVADLKQQLEETKTTLRDLAIQKIDNYENTGSLKAAIEASQTEKLQNAVDFDEARGLITDPRYYSAMMENSKMTISYLTSARNDMQKAFDEAVKNNTFKVGDDQWYEELDKLYQIDAEIDAANSELEEFQNAINDIYWEAFDELINQLDYISDETQGLIDIMSKLDMVSKPNSENGWGADDVQWTKEGLATLGLHAQELERAEEKAKAYTAAIDDLKAEYKAGHYSESEYLEKLNELTEGQYNAIKAAQDEKDAIVDLNKTRIDAIKEGVEKEIDAYEKLIDKKKEELGAEVDLYNFQKTTAEQQKSIADIERKLAALANDNSMSAIAKRKKLEAELAEAQYELENTYYERSIDDKQDALDKELESFKAEKDAEVDQLDEYLLNVEQVVAESLGLVQSSADEVYNTLNTKADEYGLKLSDAVLSPWTTGASAIDEYTTKFGDSASSTTAQLEAIRAKWQEVKSELAAANKEADKYYKAGTTDSQSVAAINKENAGYITAKNTSATTATSSTTTNNQTTKNSNTSNQKAPPSIGSTVKVKTSAKNFGSKSGSAKMASFVPGGAYTVYQVSDGQVLIGRNGSYTGWVNLKDLDGYAKGSKKIPEDQLAWIDELGEEMQLIPGANGRLEYIKKGTGIIPADLTERLMDLAMNPQEVLDRSRPQITPSKSVINNNMEIRIDASVGELIHVEHLDGNNLDEINKVVNKAWEKKMQGLNSAIKRFSR